MKKATSSRLVFYNDDSEKKPESVSETEEPVSERTDADVTEIPVEAEKTEPKAEKPVEVNKPEPAEKSAPKEESEKKLSDIDLLLQELDIKK